MKNKRMKNKRKITAFLVFVILLIADCPAYCAPLEMLVSEEKELPIIMYHNISSKKSALSKYVISPDEFEQDLAYLQKNGYTSVLISDLIDFVINGYNLPEKPILLTFDDGDYGIDKYALPLLEKYDMKAVVSVIGKKTDEFSSQDSNSEFPNLTWNQINRLIKSGRIEIQNHSYDLHKGIGAKKKGGETDESYKTRLSADLDKMQNRIVEMTGIQATAFAYPFGAISHSSDAVLKDLGFSASFSCYEKVNKVVYNDKECLFQLGRFLRPHGKTLDKILNIH